MKFYYLSYLQKIDISITTFMFLIFITILRPLLLNQELNSIKIISYTLLFFAWYGCTLLFSNAYTYESNYNKLNNI
jgi:hypothetical protein